MIGQIGQIGRLIGQIGSVPSTNGSGLLPPSGFIYLTDNDGTRLTDSDGAYLMELI